MPSVRVRRRGYSTIHDGPVTPTIPSAQPGPSVSRADALPSRPRAQSDAVLRLDTGNTLGRRSRDSDDVFQTPQTPLPDLNVLPSPSLSRSSSKVIRHVQSRSSRSSFRAPSNRARANSTRPPLATVFSHPGQQPSSPSERGQLTISPEPLATSRSSGSPASRSRQLNERGDVVLEGMQEDIIVPGEGIQMGRVGSALSHTGSEGEEGSVFADHHDDDIVEHLDVVGEPKSFCDFAGLQHLPTCMRCGTDPHVATVSALANTANAIMMSVPTLSLP